VVCVEDLFDLQVEDPCNLEGKRQRRIIFAGFDGIDALAGNVQPLSEVGLAPAPLCAEHFQAVLHRNHQMAMPFPIPNARKKPHTMLNRPIFGTSA